MRFFVLDVKRKMGARKIEREFPEFLGVTRHGFIL
jgi:hypothetical protein